MPAWSRDNRNNQIITFDRTDDIHLLTFVNLCLHQEKFKGYPLQLLSEPRFRAILVSDPNNLLKSYVRIGNIDLHKCGDFHKVLRNTWKAVDNFTIEPRFHDGIYTSHFRPHINPV